MGPDRNSTHTVVVRTENRGLQVVIGAAVLYAWLRWWWTGSLFATVASAVPADVQEGQFGSVTGTLLPIVVDLLGFVGSLVISVGGFGWRAIWDLISGTLETLGLFTKQEAATQAAVDAATQSATMSAASDAGYVAGMPWVKKLEPVQTYSKPIPSQSVRSKRAVDLDKVAKTLQDHDDLLTAANQGFASVNDRIDAIGKTLPADAQWYRELIVSLDEIKARIRVAENSLGRIGEWQGSVNLTISNKVMSREEVHNEMSELHDRLEALEQSTIKKPPTRKATRQAPAKRSTKAKA